MFKNMKRLAIPASRFQQQGAATALPKEVTRKALPKPPTSSPAGLSPKKALPKVPTHRSPRGAPPVSPAATPGPNPKSSSSEELPECRQPSVRPLPKRKGKPQPKMSTWTSQQTSNIDEVMLCNFDYLVQGKSRQQSAKESLLLD